MPRYYARGAGASSVGYSPTGVGSARLGWPQGGGMRMKGGRMLGWQDPTIPTLLVMLIVEIVIFDCVRAMTKHAG